MSSEKLIGEQQACDLESIELSSAKTGEKFSFSTCLSERFGFKDIFVHHESLLPGRRLSSLHSHSHREEMIFVLEGHPEVVVLRDGNETREKLKPGDSVGFLSGVHEFHTLENQTSESVKVLVIASNSAYDRVHYSE